MEIKIYEEYKPRTLKVFFVMRDGELMRIIVGNESANTGNGFQFRVDDYVAFQIDKCELYLEGFAAKLRVREGEVIDIPTDEDKEAEIAELQRQIDKLREDIGE